jgi:hypothetical protein
MHIFLMALLRILKIYIEHIYEKKRILLNQARQMTVYSIISFFIRCDNKHLVL